MDHFDSSGVDGAGSLWPVLGGPFRLASRFQRGSLAVMAALLVGLLALMPATIAAQTDDQARTTDYLNLRSGPSLDHDILDVMPVGSLVEITGEPEQGFYPVTWGEQDGYSHGDYLTMGVDEAALVDGSDGYTQDEIVQIIYAYADQYGQPREDMLRVARCESVLDPYAVNASSNASGLFQFLPSTWATTPFADQDIFNAEANAEAAAWMWANGRRGEWSCQ